MNQPKPGIDDAMLHAYVDDRLDSADRARVEAHLLQDAEATRKVEAWAAQADALRAAFPLDEAEPVPAAMRALFARPSLLDRTIKFAPRMAALLLVAVLSAGAGWWGHARLGGNPLPPLPREAARAHAIYTAEVLHAVEVPASEEKHLVAWLSKRLGTQLKAPYLGNAGFNLVGGRLLPAGRKDLAAQFMYENPRGERLTLYIRDGEPGEDSSFRVTEENGATGFYWVDNGYGYALVGPLRRDAMLPIAREVYAQLIN